MQAVITPITPSAADARMYRLLGIPTGGPPANEQQAYRLFSTSIFLSALRCLLTYVVLPILAPLIGSTGLYGPGLGVGVGVVALVFDVRAVRRFWLAKHRLRWPMTYLYLVVILLVTSLIIGNVVTLAS